MSITWRMKIYDATFTSRTQPGKVDNVLTPADAFSSLDSFDVDGAGNCLEARFRAVPSLVDIQPRDIVILEVSEDGGSTYTAVYRGYIVVAGNKRSKKLEAYKAVGLKQRFYEKINPMRYSTPNDSADIATMASDLFGELVTASDLPSGVSTGSVDAPSLSVALGVRYPQREYAGNTFDAFAEQAGAFIVASGTTYIYDGVTYEAGSTVPAVEWGVNAAGEFFFRRPQFVAIAVNESDADVLVNYEDVVSEKAAEKITLLFANNLQQGAFDKVVYNKVGADPISDATLGQDLVSEPLVSTHVFGGGTSSDDATKLVVVDTPQALITKISSYSSFSGTVTNPSNVDGNDATFATMTNGGISVVADASYSAVSNPGYIARVKFQATSSTNSVRLFSSAFSYPSLSGSDYRLEYSATNLSDDTVFDVYIPFLRGLNTQDFAGVPTGSPAYLDWDIGKYLTIVAVNVNCYLLEIFVPDSQTGGTLDQDYAEIFTVTPEMNVAQVSQYGSLGSVSQTMTFTPAGESAVDVPVERIEYTLTTREGLVTTYHLGQAYDAELLSERAVLEALAQRATR